METILDLLKEVLKGVVREVSAHVFRKVLEKEKTTRSRRKQKGGFHRR